MGLHSLSISALSVLCRRPVDSHVPFWNLLLLRMIMTLPYLYGSFAKVRATACKRHRAQPSLGI